MHRVHAQDVEGGGRIAEQTRELAVGTSPADVEVGFSRKPHGRVVLDDNVQPFGPSAPLRRLDVGTLKVDPNLDRAFSDTDLRAKEAVIDLYGRGTPVSKIQRAFSVGAFGIEKNRRFVPTRWSITAVDDTIGKQLRDRVHAFPLINEIRVYEAIGFDDRSEEHTSELQSPCNLVCRLLLEKKKRPSRRRRTACDRRLRRRRSSSCRPKA